MEIFGREGRERNLVEKIEICLPFKISEHDALPKSLCYRCMYLLENFYDFRKNCVNSVCLLESCVSDPEGNNVVPQLRLEFEQLKSQLQQLDLQRDKERRDFDDFMPRLEPQVPATSYSSRRSSSEANRPSPVCSPPHLERNEDCGANWADCEPDMELADSDSSLRETVHIQTRRKLNHSPMHSCKVCSRMFVSWSQLNVHMRSHTHDQEHEDGHQSEGSTLQRPFTCDLCYKSYALPRHLWTHVSSAHRGDPAVTCPVCEQVCTGRDKLDEHLRVRHGLGQSEEPRKHMQAMLNTLLSRREALQHVCAACARVFPGEADLRRHCASQQCLLADGKQPAEVSLLKQTLLKSRVTKCSLPCDFPDEPGSESVARKRAATHDGHRRKNSRPRKIAREKTSELCEDDVEPEDRFVCDVCSVIFQTADQLVDHRVVHLGCEDDADAGVGRDKPFTCLLCDKSFLVRQLLSRHLLACHGIDPLEVTCVLNKQSVPSTSTEVRKINPMFTDDSLAFDTFTVGNMETVEDQSNKNFFSCEVCIREFNDRSSLWLHMLYAHKEQAMFACGICLKVCVDNGHLMTHWKEHNSVLEQRRYICQICGRQHDTRKKLVIHVGIHCLDDGQGGTYDPEAVVLQNHAFYNPEQKVKDGEGNFDTNSPECRSEGQACRDVTNDNFTCEVCYKTFVSEEKLVKHKKNSHKDETSSNNYRGTYQLFFVCEQCGSSHHSKSERWRHVYKSHGSESILKCDRSSCGKVFTTRALCQDHCANHHQLQGDIPNTCEVCGKLWGSRVDFWKHMMGVHSDLVPLTCGVCLKILCEVSELKAHVRAKHWPLVGDFCCDICGRSYSNQSKMSRHRKIHEDVAAKDVIPEETVVSIKKQSKAAASKNEKLWCDACPEQEFVSISQLAQHRRSAHSLYPCDICTKFYGRTTHLLNHVRRKHKDEPQLICALCLKLCSSKIAVSAHIAKNHVPKGDVVKVKKRLPNFKSSKGTYGQKCSSCSKVFWKRSVYRKHVRGCRNKMVADISCVQTCELCNVFSCSSKTELLKHVRVQHPGHPNFTCSMEDCLRVLRSHLDLELHLKMHTMDVAFATCDLCGEVYDSEIKIWKHLYNNHKLKELEGLCGICLRALPTVEDLKAHVKDQHPGACDKPNTCKLCARTYTGSYKVLLHIAKCHSSYSACRTCLEMFTDPFQLAAHCKTHTDEVKDDKALHEEDDCAEQETEEQLIVNLQDKRHSVECDDVEGAGKRPKRSYDCELCTRSFQSPSALSEHKKHFHVSAVSEFKPYHCSTCSKHFSNKTSYWKHINSSSHASARKIAASSSSLGGVCKSDDLSESQEDIEASYVGSEGFDSNHSLHGDESSEQEGVHGPLRRRSETRKVYAADAAIAGPYFCCLCGKKWPGRKHLWQHLIRNHRKEAAVTCGVCLTVCSDYQDLSRHLSVQHPDNFVGDGNNFTCRTCGRYHNARCKLLQHVLIHIVLGPGPEKQPPSLTEIMVSRETKSDGSVGDVQHDMSVQPKASDQMLSVPIKQEADELRSAIDNCEDENSKAFLEGHFELSCQHCDEVSFDSFEDLLKHQATCQGNTSEAGDGDGPILNDTGSIHDDDNLLEESHDSSAQSSSFNDISSPLNSCTEDYVVGNSITDNSGDTSLGNADGKVLGDGAEFQQNSQSSDPALDCTDSISCESSPSSIVEDIRKGVIRGSENEVDLSEESCFQETSVGNASYKSKGCIRLGLQVAKRDGSGTGGGQRKGGYAAAQGTKLRTCEVDGTVEDVHRSNCKDDVECGVMRNGLPEGGQSPVGTVDSEDDSVCFTGEKVDVADLPTDGLNSLEVLNIIESVNM